MGLSLGWPGSQAPVSLGGLAGACGVSLRRGGNRLPNYVGLSGFSSPQETCPRTHLLSSRVHSSDICLTSGQARDAQRLSPWVAKGPPQRLVLSWSPRSGPQQEVTGMREPPGSAGRPSTRAPPPVRVSWRGCSWQPGLGSDSIIWSLIIKKPLLSPLMVIVQRGLEQCLAKKGRLGMLVGKEGA